MFGPLPRHAQAAEGHPNSFVADEAWRQALGKTDFGGQRERPPARGLAEGPRTLVQQAMDALTLGGIEYGLDRVWDTRLLGKAGEPTLREGMQGVADGLDTTADVLGNLSRAEREYLMELRNEARVQLFKRRRAELGSFARTFTV